MVVDIPRLTLKTRAVKLPQASLPHNVARNVKEGLTYYTLIGIDLSGGRTLDELMLARTLLFDKIYRHQKVRAAEVMVASIILRLVELSNNISAMIPYKLTDEELINMDTVKVESIIGKKENSENKDKIEIICDISCRLRERRLFVRCIAFANTMPNDAYSGSDIQKQGLERLLRRVLDPQSALELAQTLLKKRRRCYLFFKRLISILPYLVNI